MTELEDMQTRPSPTPTASVEGPNFTELPNNELVITRNRTLVRTAPPDRLGAQDSSRAPADPVEPSKPVRVSFSTSAGVQITLDLPLLEAQRIAAELTDRALALHSEATVPARPQLSRGRPPKARFGTAVLITPAGSRTFLFASMRELATLLGCDYTNLTGAYRRHCHRLGLEPDDHPGTDFCWGGATIHMSVRD